MKIPIFPGKYHENGGFSMAMLVYRSVYLLWSSFTPSKTHTWYTQKLPRFPNLLNSGPPVLGRLLGHLCCTCLCGSSDLSWHKRWVFPRESDTSWRFQLHPWSLTASLPLKRDHPKRKLIFQPSFCRGELLIFGGVVVNWWFGLLVWDSRGASK